MAKFKVTFKRSVTKDFISIPKQDVVRILTKIESLSDKPRAVKNGVYWFKQLVNLHSIVGKIVLAINSLIFLSCLR